jgi:membrane protease YdiL (CAAX protease family)
MNGAFGRFDWVANAVLFGLYHVHKIWFWPSMIASSFGYAWAAKRYRSLWLSMIVHGVESYYVALVFSVIIGWYP